MGTRTPKGLKARGGAFWRHVMKDYELTDSEQHVLLEVCRTLDNLDRLAEAIERDGPMVPGSQGQSVLNPALTEARGQRLALHRLISALNLPDDEGETMPGARSIAGKDAMASRWKGHVKAADWGA